MPFIQTPHEAAPLKQWADFLANLLKQDQRKPEVAMAVRRAKQHLAKINKPIQVKSDPNVNEATDLTDTLRK